MKVNVMIAMSGGTTTVINSTLAGIIEAAKTSPYVDKIFAGVHGLHGIMENQIINLSDLSDEEIKKMRRTPASGVIGTSRIKTLSEEEIQKVGRILKEKNVKYFINIGGSGTIKQSIHLSENFQKMQLNVRMISLPKTVDNDFGDKDFKKMFFNPGFPSCAKYWKHKVEIFNQENIGAKQHDQVIIAQTFGRKTGFLAGSTRLADPKRKLPLIILLPEDQRSISEVIEKIKQVVEKNKRAIVIISEGYDIGNLGEVYDFQNQTRYGSSKNTAAQLLTNICIENGLSARACIPGFDQRDEILLSSTKDLDAAYNLGIFCIQNLEKVNYDFLVVIPEPKSESENIEFQCLNLLECKDFTRKMHERWIDYGNFDVTDDYVTYLSSLLDANEINGNSFCNSYSF